MKLLDTLIFFSLSISIAIDQKLIVAFVCHLLTEIISQNNSNQSYGRMFLSKANCNFYQINSKYTTTKCEFQFKSSQAKLHFQYPQKTSGIQSYHDVFRGYRKRTLVIDGLTHSPPNHCQFVSAIKKVGFYFSFSRSIVARQTILQKPQ